MVKAILAILLKKCHKYSACDTVAVTKCGINRTRIFTEIKWKIYMLFSINDANLAYEKNFDEFPGRHDHSYCPSICLCGERDGQIVADTSRHRNFMPIISCRKCGSLRSTPYFIEETSKHYYAEVYGPVHRYLTTPLELQQRQLKTSVKKMLGKYYENSSSILDFGGGAGGRTLDGIQDGKKVALIEMEEDFSNVAYVAGLKPHVVGDRYDLIVISHVIEHLLDPKETMASIINEFCMDGGLIYISTPLIEKTKTRKWLSLFHVAHKYYFTRDSLVGLLYELGAQPEVDIGDDGIVFKIMNSPMPDKAEEAYLRSKKLIEQKMNWENGIWNMISPKRWVRNIRIKRRNAKLEFLRYF